MTDSKTPEWAMSAADEVWTALANNEANGRDAEIALFSQALLSAYQSGRKEGLEEAANVAEAHQVVVRLFPYGGSPTENEAAEAGQEFAADEIEAAIRQLLEVKG